MAIAWATVATLVLLLPGFLFFTGFSAPAKFSRDTTPRSAIGQLAAIVLVSFFVHALLVVLNHGLSSVFGTIPQVDLRLVLSALQSGTRGSAGVQELALNLEQHTLAVATYIGVSVGLGFGIGYATSKTALAGPLDFLLEHRWVYQLTIATGSRFAPSYAYILTKLNHEGRYVIYKGPLYQFGLRQDGQFAYLVLRQAERFYLHLGPEKPATIGPGAVIGATRTAGNVDELFQSREIDFLYVTGDEIANVMFERFGFLTPKSVNKAIEAIDQAQAAEAARVEVMPPKPPS